MKIGLFYDGIKYRIRETGKVKRLIEKVIRKEKKIPGDLNFIFTGDNEIRKMNSEYLEHDYFTDVIAFDYSAGRKINGEIYISIETVKLNAINYKVSLKNEIIRVMVHGTLHLCGMDDVTDREKERMREKEDNWIERFYSWR